MAGDGRSWEPVFLEDSVPRPVGAYTPAVRAGDFVFVSGQVPKNLETGELVGDDVATQTRAVLANLRRVLETAGATLDDVVSVTAYLADIGDWEAFNAAYRAELRHPYPARTTVGSGLHGFLVEISAVAYVGRR